MSDEQHEIELAQQRLQRARARQLPPAAIPGHLLTSAHVPDTLGALLAALPARGAYPCNGKCGARLALPGRCDECSRKVCEAATRERVRGWLKTLPERQQDVTWRDLPRLRNEKGGPRLTVPGGGNLAAKLDGWRRLLEGNKRGVLLGSSGTGKTTLGVAHLRAQLEARPTDRVRFICAPDLLRPETPDGGPGALVLALSADVLLLDEFGAEVNGVRPGAFELPKLIAPGVRVICERFERGLPTLVTTGLTQEQVEGFYGDRTARRLYDGAACIGLGAT